MSRRTQATVDLSALSAETNTKVMVVTPDKAMEWLNGNTHNRPIRQRDIQMWTKAMMEGKWKLNGDSIIFSNDGKLLDGQHRLWACVESKTPFTSVVVTGIDPDTFVTIDQGRSRSGADHLFVAKVKGTYLTNISAACTLIWRYRNDSIFSNGKIPPDELVTMAQAEPDISTWVDECRRAPISIRGFATPLAATLYLGSQTKHSIAKQFIYQWQTGENLDSGNPVLTLRNRVMGKIGSHAWERFFLAVSAWNYYSQNKPL